MTAFLEVATAENEGAFELHTVIIPPEILPAPIHVSVADTFPDVVRVGMGTNMLVNIFTIDTFP